MPDPCPLALSAAALRAAGWETFQVEKGASSGLWCWIDYEAGKVKMVPDLTAPERLGEAWDLMPEGAVLIKGRNVCQASMGLTVCGEVYHENPAVALLLAFLDAAGTPRPEGW